MNYLLKCDQIRKAILQDDAEDIHSWVESKLIDKVGNLGKKNYILVVAVTIKWQSI